MFTGIKMYAIMRNTQSHRSMLMFFRRNPTSGLPDFPRIIDVAYDMPSALRVRPNTSLTKSFHAAWNKESYETDEQFRMDLSASYAYVQYALLKCDLLKNVKSWSGNDQDDILTWLFKPSNFQLSRLTSSIKVRKAMYRNFYMLVMLKCGINLTNKQLLAPNQVTDNSMEDLEDSWNTLQRIFLDCYKPCGVHLTPFRNLANLDSGVVWEGTLRNLYIRYSRLFYCLVELCLTSGQLPAQDDDDTGGKLTGGKLTGGKLIVGGGGGNTVGGNTGGRLEDVFTPEGSCEYTRALRDRKKARLLDLQDQLAECNARHDELDLELSLNSEMQAEPEGKKKRNMGLALGAAATVGLGYTYYKTRGV
jgi:hypothetical protein